jgi:hypothetical protein
MRPEATEEDVEFILDSIRDYLTVKVFLSPVLYPAPLYFSSRATSVGSLERTPVFAIHALRGNVGVFFCKAACFSHDRQSEYVVRHGALTTHPISQVRRSDVLSSWCGIRPLVADPSSGNTENITRDHLIIARSNMGM